MLSAQNKSDRNLVISVGMILCISGVCALYTALTIDGTLTAFADSQSMALLITDGNRIVSDDGKLGRQLTDATVALQVSRDVSYALVGSTFIMGFGLIIKIFRSMKKV